MYRVSIENFAHNAKGIAKINGKIVFVSYALPNEIVDIDIVSQKKDYSIANLIDIKKPSKERIEPICKYYGLCGGCDLQHANYSYQLELKKFILKQTIKKIAKFDFNDIVVVASKNPFYYRRRVKFKCIGKEYGFNKKKSNEDVLIDRCVIADEAINDYISKNRCKNYEILVDDKGLINPKKGFLDLSFIKDGLYINYSPKAFVQVNRYINIKMIEALIDMVKKEHCSFVLDFFGGIGNFSIPLAAIGCDVVNLEYNKSALNSFKDSARMLNLSSKLKSKRINLFMPFNLKEKPDCVVLDPPRSGAKRVMSYILNSKPKTVFYFSCEPSTLARDISSLLSLYDVEKMFLFDMFPQTHHFETLVKLKIR